MYAMGCNFANAFYMKGAKYRTYCLKDDDEPRTDETSLEYVLWRLTRHKRADRLEDVPVLLNVISNVTHIY